MADKYWRFKLMLRSNGWIFDEYKMKWVNPKAGRSCK